MGVLGTRVGVLREGGGCPMSVFHCQHPEHQGDRLIKSPLQQYMERREYVRLDRKKRKASLTLRRVCSECADRDIARFRSGKREKTLGLWGR